MKVVWLLFPAIGAFTTPAVAETVFGMYAGVGSWLQDYQGQVTSGIASVDVEDDLAIGEEQNNIFFLSIEHPVAVLPNVRLRYALFDAQDRTGLTRTIDFNGAIFPAGTDIESLVDMTQADAVFYYPVLDSALSLDLGLAARFVEGDIRVASSSVETRAEFEAWLPVVYARARVGWPFSGFFIGAETMGLGYSNESLIDATAQLGWESRSGFGIEIGYRRYTLDLGEHGGLDHNDVDVSGPYVALNAHF